MTTPRRRIIRLPTTPPPACLQRQRHVQRLRDRLDKERDLLARWMKRLKRAFHTLEKHQAQIARLERQLARLDQ